MDLNSQKIALYHSWQAYQSPPHAGRAGIVEFSSAQPTTQLADPPGRLLGAWSFVCHRARGPSAQHTPLVFTQNLVARSVWFLTTQHSQPVNTPSHDNINGQARLYTIRIIQAAVLDPASALDRAMVHFDAPASAIPAKPLAGIFETLSLNRGQKHPID